MKKINNLEKGFVLLGSGLFTMILMMLFNYLFSPSCSSTRDLSVPFVIIFQLIGSALAILGLYYLIKYYSKGNKFFKKKKKSKKR